MGDRKFLQSQSVFEVINHFFQLTGNVVMRMTSCYEKCYKMLY
jgi:hypothetical protein